MKINNLKQALKLLKRYRDDANLYYVVETILEYLIEKESNETLEEEKLIRTSMS